MFADLRLFRGAFLLFFILLGNRSTAQSLISEETGIKVFIVAVNSFEQGTKWDNDELGAQILARASELERVFKKIGDNVEIIKITDATRTTDIGLRQFFKNEFRKKASNTISFLFIISHGETNTSGNKFWLVTSNAQSYDNGTIRGTDIIEYIHELDNGSFVFTFIDACHSGATDRFREEVLGVSDLNKHMMRLFLAVSSRARELSFNTNFTRALVHLFDDPELWDGCFTPNKIKSLLPIVYEKLDIELNAQSDSRILVPYFGTSPFCFDNLFDNNVMLLLLNPLPNTVKFEVWRREGEEEVRLPLSQSIGGKSIFSAGLPPGEYILRIDPLNSGNWDLSEALVLGSSPSYKIRMIQKPKDLSYETYNDLYKKAISVIEYAGADSREIASAELDFYSNQTIDPMWIMLANFEPGSSSKERYNKLAGDIEVDIAAKNVRVASSTVEEATLNDVDILSSTELADHLMLERRFDEAYVLYQSELNRLPTPEEKLTVLKRAYYTNVMTQLSASTSQDTSELIRKGFQFNNKLFEKDVELYFKSDSDIQQKLDEVILK